MIGMVARNVAGFSIANEKHYDAWGKLRYDGGTGSSGQILNPSQQYCGNLGHKYDSTNGLVYMRARYDEAETGRYSSEDPAGDGENWYIYCCNDPLNLVDETGCEGSAISARLSLILKQVTALMTTIGGVIVYASIVALYTCGEMTKTQAKTAAIIAALCYALASACTSREWAGSVLRELISGALGGIVNSAIEGAGAGKKVGGFAMAAVIGITTYTLILVGELAAILAESFNQ